MDFTFVASSGGASQPVERTAADSNAQQASGRWQEWLLKTQDCCAPQQPAVGSGGMALLGLGGTKKVPRSPSRLAKCTQANVDLIDQGERYEGHTADVLFTQWMTSTQAVLGATDPFPHDPNATYTVLQAVHTPGPLPGSGAVTPATLSRYAAASCTPGPAPLGSSMLEGLDGHPLSVLRRAVDAACAPRPDTADIKAVPSGAGCDGGGAAGSGGGTTGNRQDVRDQRVALFSPLPAPAAFASWQREGNLGAGEEGRGLGRRRQGARSRGGVLAGSGDTTEEEEEEDSEGPSLAARGQEEEDAGDEEQDDGKGARGAAPAGAGLLLFPQPWSGDEGGDSEDEMGEELLSLVRDMDMSTVDDGPLAPPAAAPDGAGEHGGDAGAAAAVSDMLVSPAPMRAQQQPQHGGWQQHPSTPCSPAELVLAFLATGTANPDQAPVAVAEAGSHGQAPEGEGAGAEEGSWACTGGQTPLSPPRPPGSGGHGTMVDEGTLLTPLSTSWQCNAMAVSPMQVLIGLMMSPVPVPPEALGAPIRFDDDP